MSTGGRAAAALVRTVRPLWSEAREQAERLARTFRFDRSASQRPLPRVKIAVGPRLPGWVLRLIVVVLAIGCVALVAHTTFLWVVAGSAALALAARPGGLAIGIFASILGFALATSTWTPGAPRSYLLLFGLHLLVQLVLLVGPVRLIAVLDLRVLLGPARRFLLLQVFAQGLALGGAKLSAAGVSLPWLPVVVGAGLVVLAWRLLSRLTAR